MSSSLNNESGVRIKQKAALFAPEHGPLHEFFFRKDVPNRGVFLVALAVAVEASALSVEGVEFSSGGLELVGESFDGLLYEFWVHGYEVHGRMVQFLPQRSTCQVH